MQVVKKMAEDKLVVGVAGRIDTETAVEFGHEVSDDLDDVNSLVIDMSRVEYISSIGLRIILEFHKQMQQKGSMTLIRVPDNIMSIFDMTGFSKFLNIQ